MRLTSLAISSLILIAACGGGSDTDTPAVCGDGVKAGDEVCDDGNATDGDGCNDQCQFSGCGDAIVDFNEACDDGNTTDGDGCDHNCTQTICGNGIVTDGEVCDDGNGHDEDGCDSNCRPSGCGNGHKAGTEECDDGNAIDGDGCDMNCKPTGCGNSIMTAGEQCDDGNTVSADGCSATCNLETPEIEPNEDGSPSIGEDYEYGNDFAVANADLHPAITADTTITAALDPDGDEDVFKITNTGAEIVQVTAQTWNLAAGYGVGVACDDIDTVVNVRNATGAILYTNNDRDYDNDDYCSRTSFGLAPGQSLYVQVMAYYDDTSVPLYALDVAFAPVVCGDGKVGPGETCDDSNTTATDGCSATCQLENAVSEVEPNEDGTPSVGGDSIDGNDFGTTFPDMNAAVTGSRRIVASFSPVGDEDIFRIVNNGTTKMDVTIDTWYLGTGYGAGVACGDYSVMDTGILVKTAAGVEVARNDDRASGTDYCSHVVAGLLPGESRYVQIVTYDDRLTVVPYLIDITYAPTVCGDNIIGAGENCDDGNTMNGDGCSSTCRVEEVCGDGTQGPTEQCEDGNTMNGDGCSSMCAFENPEIEPNEDGTPSTGGTGIDGNDFGSTNADTNGAITANGFKTASISPIGDEDVFKITNTAAAPMEVHLDIWNIAPTYGIGVACGSSIDTGMALRDATGMELASNDDRNGSNDRCSTLAYVLAPGASAYAHVIEYSDDDRINAYALQVRFVPVVCGDGIVASTEQCDDGNTMNGDGCSSTCTAVPEVEPNDDGMVSTGGTGIDGNDFATANPSANASFTTSFAILGAISPAGDEDIYKLTNTGSTSKNVRLDTWDASAAYGIGVECDMIDTGLTVRDSAGMELDSNDERSFSDSCSGLDFTIAAGASVYIHVVDYQDNDVIPSYFMIATYH